MGNDTVAMLQQLVMLLQSAWKPFGIITGVVGFFIVGAAVFGFTQNAGRGQGGSGSVPYPYIVAAVVGAILIYMPAFMDGVSYSIFGASGGYLSYMDPAKKTGGDAYRIMIHAALIILGFWGYYSIAKGWLLVKRMASPEGGRDPDAGFGAITHMGSGFICVNFQTFALGIGDFIGGPFGETIQTLLDF